MGTGAQLPRPRGRHSSQRPFMHHTLPSTGFCGGVSPSWNTCVHGRPPERGGGSLQLAWPLPAAALVPAAAPAAAPAAPAVCAAGEARPAMVVSSAAAAASGAAAWLVLATSAATPTATAAAAVAACRLDRGACEGDKPCGGHLRDRGDSSGWVTAVASQPALGLIVALSNTAEQGRQEPSYPVCGTRAWAHQVGISGSRLVPATAKRTAAAASSSAAAAGCCS